MVQGTGVDIVEIDRFRNLSDEQEFIKQLLTETEIRSTPRGMNQGLHYATLFAIKEALLKALGCGLHDGSFWHDVEVDENGAPRLSGRLEALARRRSVSAIHSSQSSSEQCVVAFVLLENNRQEDAP